MTSMVIPEELDARIESTGAAASISEKSFILEPGRSGGFLRQKSGAGRGASNIGRESQPIARGTRRQANPRQCTPSLLDILPERLLRIRTRVGRDHIETAGEIV